MTPAQITAAFAVPLSVALIGAIGKIVLDARKRAAEDVKRAAERTAEAMTVRRLLAFAAGVKPDDLTMAMVQSLINSQSNTVEGMRSMVRSVPHPFLCWAKERVSASRYHMLDFNESFRSVIVGGPREIYIGKRDREVFHNDDADLFERNDERAFQAGPQAVKEPFLSELTGARGTFEGVKWHLEIGDRQILFGLGSWVADGQLTFPLNHTGD
jgi:hypothetical protein